MERNIFLIGFMGAGKSAVAGELEKRLGIGRIEMDQCIEEEQGISISEIFEKYGEEHFRDLESDFIVRMQNREPCVVSCGGGAVLREKNAEYMKQSGRVVLLTAEPETIYERVKDNDKRPVLNNNMNVGYIAGLMKKREERYLAAADVIIKTDGKNVEQVCDEIIKDLD